MYPHQMQFMFIKQSHVTKLVAQTTLGATFDHFKSFNTLGPSFGLGSSPNGGILFLERERQTDKPYCIFCAL